MTRLRSSAAAFYFSGIFFKRRRLFKLWIFLDNFIISTSRCSIVVSIPACHAGDPGSIPGNGVLIWWNVFNRRRVALASVFYGNFVVTKSRRSIVVSIPACHAGDPASIPGNGVFIFAEYFLNDVVFV